MKRWSQTENGVVGQIRVTMKNLRAHCFSLVVGVAFNVIFAWACMVWSPYKKSDLPSIPLDGRIPAETPGPYEVMRWWWTGEGFGVSNAEPTGAALSEGAEYMRYWRGSGTPAFHRCGWPFLAMESTVNSISDADGHNLSKWSLPFGEIFRRGLQTNSLPDWMGAQDERRVPLMPIWSGFALNSLLYYLLTLSLMVGFKRYSKNLTDIAPSSAAGNRLATLER